MQVLIRAAPFISDSILQYVIDSEKFLRGSSGILNSIHGQQRSVGRQGQLRDIRTAGVWIGAVLQCIRQIKDLPAAHLPNLYGILRGDCDETAILIQREIALHPKFAIRQARVDMHYRSSAGYFDNIHP